MSTTTSKGYLEFDYLTTTYLGGDVYLAEWMQTNRKIADHLKLTHMQVSRVINATHSVHEQVERRIDSQHNVNSQVERITSELHEVNMQVSRLTSNAKITHSQTTKIVGEDHIVNTQTNRYIANIKHTIAMEVERLINDNLKSKHMEINRGNNTHEVCESYLVDPYLTKAYLVARYCVQMRMEVERILGVQKHLKMQVNRVIANQLKTIHEQIEKRIDATHPIGMQINRIQARVLHMQVVQALYNTTNLRILSDFASRGVSGLNWIASSTMTGDFSANNLNTDIDEQVWRSNTGVINGITLTCDTEVTQGVFVDTIAFRNHNMTTSASFVVQGSNSPSFATIGFSETLFVKKDNFYYISPTLPLNSYRYWRFLISDPTNTNPYIQIGTILFGSAQIMAGECFVDNVTKTRKHFADKVRTEGFTNVSNDRALKFAVALEFRSLNFRRANYTMLSNIFDSARTSLKCLWIPTPQYPERFAVFGKLSALPPESHNDKGVDADYISFSVEVDESL